MMTRPLGEKPDPDREAEIQAKVDHEVATRDLRRTHMELDGLVDGMSRSAEFLDDKGNYAGASLMRQTAARFEEALGRVRDAETVLNYTRDIQR